METLAKSNADSRRKTGTSLSPAKRKSRASLAATARWGKSAGQRADGHEYQELEPSEAVLRAATKAFAVSEAHEVTMREISDAAGVSLQTVYRYFPNKRSLISSCKDHIVKSYVDYLDHLIDLNDEPETKLFSIALGLNFVLIYPDKMRLTYLRILEMPAAMLDSSVGPIVAPYYKRCFALARKMCFPNAESRLITLISAINGMSQLVSLRESIPELNDFVSSLEGMSVDTMGIAFPGVDWASVYARTKFEPYLEEV
ncbi:MULTISPECIES: TetR/AcrR family transcriptional regulator [Sphingobium]|uniref:TetR/AcrR family transcriptional regulator n=1 Tax=Sphingobium sp. MI1205 TaxID=407020 RepID=UPI0007704D41|nr:TetR/AcrR family transcriptional regulator [Sphingobium sp. MI1205]AMK18306.1 TetR family transcriptional regulator [Sphingobium sp. MI1205]